MMSLRRKRGEHLESLEGKRVLLVDDNQLNREILKEVLTDQGLLVEEADGGSRAVVGMDDFLVKPTNSARLLRCLAKFL